MKTKHYHLHTIIVVQSDDDASLVVLAFLRSGVNSCIFAYGQTGSGKTYSMLGDLLQLGTDTTAATTNAGLLSSSRKHPENMGKCEALEADGADRLTAGNSSKEDKLGIEGARGEAGIIPRAVDDIFRIARQGGVQEEEEEAATTPTPSAFGRYSFREPPENPQSLPAATVPSLSTACDSDCASAPNTSVPGTRHSTGSSRSSSSEDSFLAQVPSAAHWPLKEPVVYIPRAHIPKEGCLSAATQRIQPCDDPKKDDTFGAEEGGGSDENRRACRQEEHGEANTTCRYSVQCSYMQVRLYGQSSKGEVG